MAKEDIAKKIELEIKKIDEKKNKILFFVVDTKGAPNGSLAYIYETALTLKELGYTIQMLHTEKEFIGVESWLGEKYSNLPHYNIEKDSVDVSPSDLLIIPEVCVNALTQTKSLPCKRVILIQNYSYLTEMLPMGINLDNVKIKECITTSNKLSEKIKKSFPNINTKIVKPSIPEYFFNESEEPKKLIINIVSKNSTDTNAILKPFYWKYPNYNWVAFREVKNLTREDFANALKEGFATVWVDNLTDFGYSALEAMACKNIVIGKVPESLPEWMTDENGNFKNNGVWFFNSDDAQDIIADVIQSFLTESIPESIYKEMSDTCDKYVSPLQKADIEEVYVKGLLENRKKELQIALAIEKNNNEPKDE